MCVRMSRPGSWPLTVRLTFRAGGRAAGLWLAGLARRRDSAGKAVVAGRRRETGVRYRLAGGGGVEAQAAQ